VEEGLLARLLSGRSGAQLSEALRSQDKSARKEAKKVARSAQARLNSARGVFELGGTKQGLAVFELPQ